MAKTPAWQRAAGKSESGGLNEKGRASLKAEGHDIKRPQPEGGARKKSFCARMEGAKKKLTSSETANDPDSRINKSLRKWNCADGGAVDPYDSVQQAAKGGPIWDKPRPKKLGKPEPLSPKEKASAKAFAKAAGRPYPNLIDNMRAARADGGELDDRAHEFVQEQLKSGEPQVPQYVAESDFPARAARGIEAVDTAASRVNNLLANVAGQPAMRSPEGRTASEVVQSATPVDPYQAVQQAARQWGEGDRLGAAETMAAGMPMQGAIRSKIPETELLLESLKKHRPEAMKRARQMGYDTNTVVFHGTDQPIEKFNPNVYVAKDPSIAEIYARKREYDPVQYDLFKPNPAPNIIPMFVKKGSLELTNPLSKYYKVFDPTHIRSVFAEFNPEHAGSSDLSRASGGEVEGDVQFAPDDPYAKVQEAAKLPMMAQHEYAMRMPEPEVLYDTGPQPGEATLKAYDPTIRERIYQGIAGTEERPSPERAQFARGMSQMAEFAPVLGNVMAGQEAQRRGDTKGMLMAALPVPGMATEARMAEAAAGPAQQAAQEAYQRVLNAQGLYSHAAEAAANLPQAKGSYEQMMAMLQKAGVKPEEMRWSGVEQFAGQPVTREQLVQHFEQGVPKIEETSFGIIPEDKMRDLREKYARSEYQDAFYDLPSEWKRKVDDLIRKKYGATKFEQYTIPGGENYREVLLHTPGKKQDLYKQISQARDDRIAAVREHGSVLKYDDPALEQERLQKIREATKRENDLRNQLENIPPEFTSSHWDQPNVLGHLRLSDRTGPQGEKILHMEELQSDWGQEGRKRGFKGDIKNIPEGYRIEKLDPAEAEKTGYSYTGYDPDGTRVLYGNSPEEVTHSLGNIVQGKSGSPPLPPAPYVEKTQNWVDLGLKRALKEAAEKGYDKLVWTPGAEQAARYDLSKQIGKIMYFPEHKNFQAIPLNGKKGISEYNVEPQDIEKYVGKDIAKKLLETDPVETEMFRNRHHALEGLDLKVGGEGMKSFYDSIIPSRLKELMKKIDPQAKVQLGSHPISKDGEEVRAHSIQITPKMREAILKGLPAYAKGGEVVNDTDPYDNIRDASKNFPRARRASH